MTGEDLRSLAEVARVVATRIRQDAANIGVDVRHPRLTMENHAKDLDRLAAELDAHTRRASDVGYNIVNQLADLWEVPVAVRQATNDRCWDFAAGLVATAAEPSLNTRHPVGRRGVPGIHHADDCPMRHGLVTTGCFCGREGERDAVAGGGT